MTAPTPEQMRALADEHWMPHEQEVSDALRAAADEVDRLREKLSRIAGHPLLFAYTRDSVETYGAIASAMKWVHEELDGTKRDRDRLRTELTQAQQDVTNAENDGIGWMDRANRLRAVIENAPHREKCRPHIACTCWKADVL